LPRIFAFAKIQNETDGEITRVFLLAPNFRIASLHGKSKNSQQLLRGDKRN